MNFLADESFPLGAVHKLRDSGHNVVSISESSPGMKNSGVAELAAREKRVLLTFDKDFSELVFRGLVKPSSGVILFRLRSFTIESLVQLTEQVLSTEKELEKSFVVVREDQIRVVPLPKEPV